METEEVIVLDSDSENPTNDQTPESPDKKPDETDKMDTSELLNIKNDATFFAWFFQMRKMIFPYCDELESIEYVFIK
uniref:CSON009973 protein n=1 Tax=Culicoides sonorensis TaxID=179676 RepID=A0A336LLA9_CULSO